MLVRTLVLLSCFACAHAFAQAAPIMQPQSAPAADSGGDAGRTPLKAAAVSDAQKAEAVPVDKSALISPDDPLLQPVKHDLENDPLFVPAAVLIGTGAASLLASLLTGLGAHSMYNSLERDCPNNVCAADQQHSINSGKTLAVVSTVLTGVGIATAGTGTVLMIIAAGHDDEPPPQPGFQVSLTSGPTPLGIGAAGRF
jgi:hypothetical protein